MGDQYDLYDGTPPHEPLEEGTTSLRAALQVEPRAISMRAQVYEYIRQMGIYGATDDEVEQALGMRHQTASARRRELFLKNQIQRSPLERKTSSGCRATVWVASAWISK